MIFKEWGNPKWVVNQYNDEMQDTQFADYHGHGWNFRAIFKRDRKGNLLDDEGSIVEDDDPEKFDKAVHMASIHMDVGMQCVDCHFSQDSHGNGHIYGEVALAVEIGCKDCHGTAQEYPNLYTSGPASLEGGKDLLSLRTPDGRRRFEWRGPQARSAGEEPRKRGRVCCSCNRFQWTYCVISGGGKGGIVGVFYLEIKPLYGHPGADESSVRDCRALFPL